MICTALLNKVKKGGKKALALFYPSFCLNCEKSTEPFNILCEICFEQLVPIEPKKCFSSLDRANESSDKNKIAGVYEKKGVAKLLIDQMEKSNRPFLAKSIASLMLVHFTRLDWPMPDAVLPLTKGGWQAIKRGYHADKLVAKELAYLLSLPLKREKDPSKRMLYVGTSQDVMPKEFQDKMILTFYEGIKEDTFLAKD